MRKSKRTKKATIARLGIAMMAFALSGPRVAEAISVTWDANNTGAGQTNGAGAWLGANQWWNGATNVTWTSGDDATFDGPATAGGAVTLASPTTVNSLTFTPSYTGTYTLGTAGQTITLNTGINKNASSGIATIISPILLGGPQTWTNNSATALNVTGGVDLGSNLLTFAGTGVTNFSATANFITGSGGITKNGSGILIIGNGGTTPVHNYTGTTTLNAGTIRTQGNLSPGNFTINGGVWEDYFSFDFTRTLGAGAGQVQILGGTSGFSEQGSTGRNVRLNNNAAFEVVWGSAFFNPTTLVLQAASAQNSSSLVFQNRLDLNGADRTIFSAVTTGTGLGSATISGLIRNTSGTPAGLIKTGGGRLNLTGANSYDGGTTLLAGTLQLGNATALGAAAGELTVDGGILNLNDQNQSVGNLTGLGGTILNNGAAARTLTIGTGNTGGGDFQGVLANNNNAGTGTLALTKVGSAAITLSGLNTYTGVTTINGGLLVLDGSILGTSDLIFSGTGMLEMGLSGLINVLQTNYSLTDAQNDIIANRIITSGSLVVSTFNNGSTNFTQITVNAAAAVPEPASASLALLGLGGLILRRRRNTLA